MADFCEHGSRYMYRCYTPDAPGVWRPQIHRSCAHNLVAGLLQRTMGPTPLPTALGTSMYKAASSQLKRVLAQRCTRVEEWSWERVVASYGVKRLRVRYEAARQSLLSDGLSTPRDAEVKAFVKAEKLSNYKVLKPRIIMGRDPRYNLELASFLKPIEHEVYAGFRGWKSMYTTTRLIGKGLSLEQRARLIRRKFAAIPEACAFEVDCKSFESHLTLLHLREEHSVYRQFCSDPRLVELLRWQESFKGRGCGVEYKVKGVRASGDFNTGLGNTLIMCCLVLASAKSLGLKFDFLADGDNAIVFCRASDYGVFASGLSGAFLEMGHEADVGEPAYELESIVFGQSKPLVTGSGRLTMVRDPFKVMSHACCSNKHYAEMRGGRKVLRAVAYCEAVLSRGVPVLQAFSQSLLKATHGWSLPSGAEMDNYEYAAILAKGVSWSSANEEVISTETRVMFERAWGISVDSQLRLESTFNRVPDFPTGWADVPPDEGFSDHRDPWGVPFGLDTATWLDQVVDRLGA